MAEYFFDEPRFTDPEAAREYLESIRWPTGPICPHCGAVDRISKLNGKAHRAGVYDCGHCRDQFTVTVGTVFEHSKVGLDKWLFAATLMASSKKGVSSKQIERMLGVTYKTAWFMTHRLREAMKEGGMGMLGGNGAIVEADETYVGGKERNKHANKRKHAGTGGAGKQAVVALIERGGNVRSHHVRAVNSATLKMILTNQVRGQSSIMTDEHSGYSGIAAHFASHDAVNHTAGEYVRGQIHTNTVEGYFSIFKRGIIGTFHHVSPQHLQRYATEFDFRYNHRETKIKVGDKWIKDGFNDAERTHALLKGISGKRLTCRRIDAQQASETR